MAINNSINGVYRDTANSSVKVNGVWRDSADSWCRVKGVWRSVDRQVIKPENVTGFKLIYTLNATRTHYDNPRLKYNPKIPYVFKLTGDTLGNMDFNKKGVIFEYKRDDPEEEGIVIYEGRLYAILNSGKLINVCQVSGNNNNKQHEDEMVSEFTSIYSVGKLNDLDIKLYGYVLFEDYGYYFAGWNNLFNTKPFIDKTTFYDKNLYKNRLELNSYNILPIHNRHEYFDSVSTIGIARDMETPDYNMIGSYGVLDHTISRITLNGIDKPFIVEIK